MKKNLGMAMLMILVLTSCGAKVGKKIDHRGCGKGHSEKEAVIKKEGTNVRERGSDAPWMEKEPYKNIKEEIEPKKANQEVGNSYKIDSAKLLSVSISNSGYTRFFIEGERITDIFVYPQEGVQVQIHNQGYLIVVPQGLDDLDEEREELESVYLTITGEEGTTQDVVLRFAGKCPEPVRLLKSGVN
jgi:hypothetical protein